MKFAGMLMLLLASSLAGCLAAGRIRGQRQALELLCTWTADAAACIRYTNAELPEVLALLAERPQFRRFRFAGEILGKLSPMAPLQLLWQAAVEGDPEIPASARDALIRLGTSLGTTDTEGQLAALSLCQTQLLKAAGDAAEDCRAKGRLYRILGVLGGLMLSVLVW